MALRLYKLQTCEKRMKKISSTFPFEEGFSVCGGSVFCYWSIFRPRDYLTFEQYMPEPRYDIGFRLVRKG